MFKPFIQSGNQKRTETTSQRAFSGLLSTLVLILTSCNYPGLNQSAPNISVAPAGTKVRLPDTWTVQPPTTTSEISPSTTPSSTPTPTLTITPTATATPEPLLTLDFGATPTIDILIGPYPDCRFIANKLGIRLQYAPFVDPYRVLPTMEPGKAYQAVIDKPTYTLLLDNSQFAGWVDYRLIGLDFEGTQCLSRKLEREITEFPNLCFFSPSEQVKAYGDPDLTDYRLDLSPVGSNILLLQYQQVYFSAYGHAGPSFYVARDEVMTSGDCQTVPYQGSITQDTQLYSQPNFTANSVISSLIIGQKIYIQPNTSPGNPPPGASTEGEWVQIRVPTNTGGLDGWCWSEFFTYN